MKKLLLLLALLLSSGCAANKVVPVHARLEKIVNPEYPYRLKLYASEHINFNVHQLEFTDFKQEMVFYIILKQIEGRIDTSNFRVVAWTGTGSTQQEQDFEKYLDRLSFVKEDEIIRNIWKGVLIIVGDQVQVNLFYVIPENGKHQAHPANGVYRLQRN